MLMTSVFLLEISLQILHFMCLFGGKNVPPYDFIFQYIKDKHLSFSESHLHESHLFCLSIGQRLIWHRLILYLAQATLDHCYYTVAGTNCPKWLLLQPGFTRGACYEDLSKMQSYLRHSKVTNLFWDWPFKWKWQVYPSASKWGHSGKSARRKV